MSEQLNTVLRESGLDEKESRVYLALMELGKGTVNEISTKANIKRPITYVILDGLIDIGYASKVPSTKINTYRAIEPIKIYHHLQGRINDFGRALPSFNALYNQTRTKPKIQYFEGRGGIRHVYRDMERAEKAWFITSCTHMNKYLPGETDRWVQGLQSETFIPKGSHLLLVQTPEDIKSGKKIQSRRYKVRYLPKGKMISMDFAIYDDKFALTSFEKEPFIVVIESANLVQAMKIVFELAWQQSEEIK